MMIRSFIFSSIDSRTQRRILEIGCGSGAYLRYYVEINSRNTGIGIERDRSAAEIARESVKANGIEGNFSIINDDFLTTQALEGKTFDLVTSYSNIYYFNAQERAALFAKVYGLLSEKGLFVLLSMVKDGSLFSSYYDCIFQATRGLYPLPVLKKTAREMKDAGFCKTKIVTLWKAASFKGIIASK